MLRSHKDVQPISEIQEIQKAYEKFGISQEDVKGLLQTERYQRLALAIDYLGHGTDIADTIVTYVSQVPDAPWSHVWHTKPLQIIDIEDATRFLIRSPGLKSLVYYGNSTPWISKDILDFSPEDLIDMKSKPGVGRKTLGQILQTMAVVEATDRFSKHVTAQTPSPAYVIERDDKLEGLFANEGLSLTTIRRAVRANPEVRAAILAEIAKCDSLK